MQAIESTTKRWAARLAGALLVVLFAGTTSAATFSVDTEDSNLLYQTGNSYLPVAGLFSPAGRWRPQGYPTIQGTGSDPVSLTVAPGLIDKAGSLVVVPIPSLPSYVQFTTALSAYAPFGGTAMFQPGAKASRPANFNWCPGAAANPACTTVLSGGAQGSISGIMKYTAGTDGPQFGGTMAILTSGPFQWYTVEATLPTYKVRLNNEGAGTDTILAGPGYSNYGTDAAGSDKIFASPPFVPTYYGYYSIITDPGTPTNTVIAGSSRGWGFPFTTGTIYIKVPWYPSPFLTITGMGQDNRTAQGTGNITMVAGGILNNPGGGFTVPQLITLTLNVPEPGRVLMLAAGAGLIGLVAVVRRRALGRAA